VANITSLTSIYIVDNYAKKSQYSLVPLSIPSLPNLNKEKAVLTKAKLSSHYKSHPHSGIVYQHIIQDGLKHLHSGQYNEASILVWTCSIVFITEQCFSSPRLYCSNGEMGWLSIFSRRTYKTEIMMIKSQSSQMTQNYFCYEKRYSSSQNGFDQFSGFLMSGLLKCSQEYYTRAP